MANQHTKAKEAQQNSEPAGPETAQSIPTPDPHFAHVLVGKSNEELIAMQAAIEAERKAKGYPKVEFGTDAHDKQVDGFGDLEYDPLGTSDPLLGLKREYERPGMALKLMSKHVTQRLGKNGYQIVKDANGDPVQCGNMLLGEIPQKVADARKRYVREKTNDELRSIKDAQREAIEKLKTDAKGLGLHVLEQGEQVKNLGDGNVYDAGFGVVRGEDE